MLSVTYHSDPDVPTNLSVTDAGLDPVILHATFSDADGVGGHVVYTIYDRLGNTVISGSGTAVANGQDSPYTVPAGTLDYDTTYTWAAQAVSGIYVSAPTAAQPYYFGDVPAGSTANSSVQSFVVQCAHVISQRDDPIEHPHSPGVSEWNDFFGNDRADANSSVNSLKVAMVEVVSAAGSEDAATFTTVQAFSFTAGEEIVAHDILVPGTNGPSVWEGDWTFDGSITATSFTAHRAGTATLQTGSGGTVGDAGDDSTGGLRDGLSCGIPARTSALTYDTAVYYTPSIYTSDGTRVDPDRQREYYFGLPDGGMCSPQDAEVCVNQLPSGLQLEGGNPTASGPSGNKHVFWTCGRGTIQSTLHIKPGLDHPYDCEPFAAKQWDFVDGPVGIVDMPNCAQTTSPTGPDDVVYPQDDGTVDEVCNGDYPYPLPILSIRMHLPKIPLQDPCSSVCLAYTINSIQISACNPGPYCADISVDDDGPKIDVNFPADAAIFTTVEGWNGINSQPFAATRTGDYTMQISGLTDGSYLPCGFDGSSTPCGTVTSYVGDAPGYVENFTITSDTPCPNSPCTSAPFYTLHASFWNTWYQEALQKLVTDCLNASAICTDNDNGEVNAKTNYQVDLLP